MADLAHLWGTDLSWSATGDLSTADLTVLTQQRLLRRLLTNPGEYVWQLGYGAALASFVGKPGAASAIMASVRGQMSKENGVASTPAPLIDISPDTNGSLYVQIRYVDAVTGSTTTVAFLT